MSSLIKAVESYVTELLTHSLDPNYRYHNLVHTRRVVENTKQLLEHSSLDGEEEKALLLAAWLHDTGYTKGTEAHEEASCNIARTFLDARGCPAATRDRVCQLIMATERYHKPKNLTEEIIRDADAAHLGQDHFPQTSEQLREELELLGRAEYTPREWRDANIEMLRMEHRFHTEYAKEHWQPVKERHLQRLLKDQKAENKLAKKEKLKAKIKEENPERSIQTMYRITMQNHLKLSDIADTKANILLSVNAIILSLVIANLIPKLDNPTNDYLLFPTAVFCLFSVASIILSVLATRPNITSGSFTREDVRQKKVNVLFFGNFHKMELKEFQWALNELTKDKQYVYDSLAMDLYYLGRVLERKYRLLRWTYTIFMIGIILSVITFFIALELFGAERYL